MERTERNVTEIKIPCFIGKEKVAKQPEQVLKYERKRGKLMRKIGRYSLIVWLIVLTMFCIIPMLSQCFNREVKMVDAFRLEQDTTEFIRKQIEKKSEELRIPIVFDYQKEQITSVQFPRYASDKVALLYGDNITNYLMLTYIEDAGELILYTPVNNGENRNSDVFDERILKEKLLYQLSVLNSENLSNSRLDRLVLFLKDKNVDKLACYLLIASCFGIILYQKLKKK